MTFNQAHRVSVRTDRLGLRQRSAGGFTLIEVLVVVAIIALLVSILLPSLQRAREQTKRIVCATNMRTVHQAMTIYLNLNRDFFPWDARPIAGDPDEVYGANPWEIFYKYVQKGLPRRMTNAEVKEKCPLVTVGTSDFYSLLDWYVCAKDTYYHTSSQTPPQILPDGTTVNPIYVISFCVPDDVCYTFKKDENNQRYAAGSTRNTSIKRQADMVLAGEYVDDTHVMRGGWSLIDRGNDKSIPGNGNQIDLFEVRHMGGCNIVYLDGHVAFHRVNWGDTVQWGLPPYPQAFEVNFTTQAAWDPAAWGHVPAPH